MLLGMWQKMCEERGVTPAHGLATDPEDPSQALIVGPTIISNDASQHAMHSAVQTRVRNQARLRNQRVAGLCLGTIGSRGDMLP